MKKTILTILLCGVMVLGITGCGEKVNKQDNQNNKTENNSSVKDNNQEDKKESVDKYLVFSKNDNISKIISLNNQNYSIKISDDGYDLEIYDTNDSKIPKSVIENSNSKLYLYKNHIIALQPNDHFFSIYNSNIKNVFNSIISDNKLVFENNNILFNLDDKEYIYDLSNEEYKEK